MKVPAFYTCQHRTAMNAFQDPTRASAAPRLHRAGRAFLQHAGDQVEAHPWLAFSLLLGIYAVAELGYSIAAPLWHDELFTFFIAQSPSLSAMWDRIRTVDLNPPLSYVLTRVSFAIFGVGTLQCRLPEIAGFGLALVCVFLFVRNRAGNTFGLLAAAMLFGSRAGELVFQARPYGLLLGTSALALLAWQHAGRPRDTHHPGADLALFFAVVAMLCTHIFGLFPWLALFVAEVFHCVRQREVAPGRALALTLALPTTLLWLPLLRNHAHSTFPAAFQPDGSDIFSFYIGHIDRELISIMLAALLLLIFVGRTWLRGSENFALRGWEWVAVEGLLAGPLLLIGELMLTHGAFFDRYGVTVCLGTACLFALFFRWWTGGRAGAALVAVFVVLLVTQRLPDAVNALAEGRILRHSEPVTAALDTSLLPDATLPLVAASGLTFLEMQQREPKSLLRRTYYLTDPEGARLGEHATIFEGLTEEAQIFPVTGHVETYHQFLVRYPHFYVLGTYDYPEDWLLRKLQTGGAELEVLGRVHGSYKDHELYEVRLDSQKPSLNTR